jgi:SAM-dependent methyltransferase
VASLAIFAVSFALLIDEIMLSAIFHVLLGAGNTVAAIAIALIGLSAGGIFAYAVPTFQRSDRAAVLYPRLLFWFSTSLLVSGLLVMRIPVSHGDFVYARGDVAVQLWRLAVYHIAVLPFFMGGLTIAVLLRSHADRVSRLYFSDLAGAAMGCLASPLLLSTLGAPDAILCGAVPAAAIAAWFAIGRRALPRSLLSLPASLLAVGALGPGLDSFATLNTMGEVRAPAYRSFSIAPGDIEFERWALDAWTIIRSDRIPQQWENFEGWGLSPRYRGPLPRIKLVNYNARFSTYVTEYDGNLEAIGDWLDSDLTSLPFLLGRSYRSVLNIGAGGGREVLAALHHGAQRVVAVDVSDVVVNDIMKGYLSGFSGGLYLDPRVTAVADEGRTFTERTHERFDLIDFSIVGGANLEKMDLVRVDDLFTLEALRTYLERLSAHGVFSYVMYSTRSDIVSEMAADDLPISQPYIPALRTLTGLRLALQEEVPEIRPSEHFLVAALPGVIHPRYDLVHIVASKSPFTDSERGRFLERCRSLGFQALHPRAAGAAEPPDPYARVIEVDDLTRFADSLPFSIRPATDDRPFQYAFDWSHVTKAFDRGSLLTLLSGNAFISLGGSIGLLAALVTLIPIAVIRIRQGAGLGVLRSSWSLLVYFACIGYGYMAVEIAVLLRLQSYLGKPIYGLSVGLFGFLFSSGLGSYVTGSFRNASLERYAYRIVALIFAIGLGFFWLSGPLFSSTLSLPLAQRALIAVAAIFPLALPMGMLFPIGVKLIARESEDLIPWAWATNGCSSVLGIFGTRIMALFVGFSRALIVGLLVYLLVAGCLFVYARLRARILAAAGLGRFST